MQTMAATKRNAGLTSAVPRATLNDEELVSTLFFDFTTLKLYFRKLVYLVFYNNVYNK